MNSHSTKNTIFTYKGNQAVGKFHCIIRELEKIGQYHEQVHQITAVYDMAHALATDFSSCSKTQIKTISQP